MTSACRRVPLTALPNRAANQLKRFLFAYQLVDSGRFVIRHADPSDNRVEELEFDPRQNRFLWADERLRLRASEPHQLRMASGQTVQVSYRTHPDRSSLLAHLDCPLAVMGGVEDVSVDAAKLRRRASASVATFQIKVLHGGHFFFRTYANELRQFVLSTIRAAQQRSRQARGPSSVVTSSSLRASPPANERPAGGEARLVDAHSIARSLRFSDYAASRS